MEFHTHSAVEQTNIQYIYPPDIDVVRSLAVDSSNQYILSTEPPNDRHQNGHKQKSSLVGNRFHGSLDDEIELVRQLPHSIERLS